MSISMNTNRQAFTAPSAAKNINIDSNIKSQYQRNVKAGSIKITPQQPSQATVVEKSANKAEASILKPSGMLGSNVSVKV